MSGGKVIFSFLDGTNLALDTEKAAKGIVVRFGSGFEDVEMRYDSPALKLISQEEAQACNSEIELVVKSRVLKDDEPVKKRAVDDTVAQNKLGPHVAFHDGTVEDKGRLTKTQKRNRYRRYRKIQEKLEREAKIVESATTSAIADRTPSKIVPTVEEYVPQYVQPLQIISEDELERFQSTKKQSFEYLQRIRGKWVNVLEGLELHTGIFSEAEQDKVLRVINDLKDKGRAGALRPRTYSEPKKWMRGKGRITIQFGCCYNYALDAEGNPPGIIRYEDVDPIPPFLKFMIRKMVSWHVLPADVIPDSCIVNIYEEGDCIPPHVDSHDFLRPFCTASFLGECDILLGTELRIKGPGEFSGPTRIPLPLGSVFVFGGNGADIAKHCVPAVPHPRISITFRKMDPRKLPYNFRPEPELQGLCPLVL